MCKAVDYLIYILEKKLMLSLIINDIENIIFVVFNIIGLF